MKMQWPKSFRTKKNLDNKIVQLIDGPKTNQGIVDELFEVKEEFDEKSEYLDNVFEKYNLAWDMVLKINYTIGDLQLFVEQLDPVKDDVFRTRFDGYMISAMVNQKIEDGQVLHLKPRFKINRLGAFLERGTLVIKHDVNHFTGYMMEGGKVIVEGNVGHWTALRMIGGEIIIKGDVNGELGTHMTNGKIYVTGKVKRLYKDCNSGTIYEMGDKQIWPLEEKDL